MAERRKSEAISAYRLALFPVCMWVLRLFIFIFSGYTAEGEGVAHFLIPTPNSMEAYSISIA